MKSVVRESQSSRNLLRNQKSVTNFKSMVNSQSTHQINKSTLESKISNTTQNSSMSMFDGNSFLSDKENISNYHLNKQYSTVSNVSFKEDLVRTDSVISFFQKSNASSQQNSLNMSSNQQQKQLLLSNCVNNEEQKPKIKANTHRRVQSTISLVSNSSSKTLKQPQIMLTQHQQEKANQVKQQKIIQKTIEEARELVKQKQIQLEDLKRDNSKLSQRYNQEKKQFEEVKSRTEQQDKEQNNITWIDKYSYHSDRVIQLAIECEQLQASIYSKMKHIHNEREQMNFKLDSQAKSIQYLQIKNQKLKQQHMLQDSELQEIYQQKVYEQDACTKQLSMLKQVYNKLIYKKQ